MQCVTSLPQTGNENHDIDILVMDRPLLHDVWRVIALNFFTCFKMIPCQDFQLRENKKKMAQGPSQASSVNVAAVLSVSSAPATRFGFCWSIPAPKSDLLSWRERKRKRRTITTICNIRHPTSLYRKYLWVSALSLNEIYFFGQDWYVLTNTEPYAFQAVSIKYFDCLSCRNNS